MGVVRSRHYEVATDVTAVAPVHCKVGGDISAKLAVCDDASRAFEPPERQGRIYPVQKKNVGARNI